MSGKNKLGFLVITSVISFAILGANVNAMSGDMLDAKVNAVCNSYGDIAVVMWKSKYKRKPESFKSSDQSILQATYSALVETKPVTAADAFVIGSTACRDEIQSGAEQMFRQQSGRK